MGLNMSKWIAPFLKPSQKQYYRRAKLAIVGSFVRYLQNKGVVCGPVVTESLCPKNLDGYKTQSSPAIYSKRARETFKVIDMLSLLGVKEIYFVFEDAR